MKELVIILVTLMVGASLLHAGTIVYSYDEEHRLAGVNYDNEATVTYAYDKANNLIEYNVLTDPAYHQPFMFWQSRINLDEFRPICQRVDWVMDPLVWLLLDG